MTTESQIPMIAKIEVVPVIINNEKVIKSKELVIYDDTLEKPLVYNHESKAKKRKDKVFLKVLSPILQPPYLLLQRLKKIVEEGKVPRVYSIRKKLLVNIPPIEALEQMPGYAKFIKDFVIKKRTMIFKPIDNMNHCSEIASRSLVMKKKNLGVFTIPFIVASFNFAKALYDLGVNNLMLLAVYRQLG